MAYWPDTGTGVDTQPARKPVQSALRKYFTEGGIGQAPTVPGGDWFNQMTNEVLNVLEAAGIDPSKTDDEQLLKAIVKISDPLLRSALAGEDGVSLVGNAADKRGEIFTGEVTAIGIKSMTKYGNLIVGDNPIGSQGDDWPLPDGLHDAVNVSRKLVNEPTNFHAFSDKTIINGASDYGGYGAYDSTLILMGGHEQNHAHSFQDRIQYIGTNRLDFTCGLFSSPSHGGSGLIGNRNGVYINDIALTGPGTVGEQSGIYVEHLQAAATNVGINVRQLSGYGYYAPFAGKMYQQGVAGFGVNPAALTPAINWKGDGDTTGATGFATTDNNGVSLGATLDTPIQFVSGGAVRLKIQKKTVSNGAVNPGDDNVTPLGISGFRWSVVYAGTGTINTSDAREKTEPQPITDAVLDAWGDVQLTSFQWLNSIRHKGELARWHFGVIAQQVRDAFLSHGLDGTIYGLLCYDEWPDEHSHIIMTRENPETGVQEQYDTGDTELVLAAGNRWGIRPDQCLFLEAAYQRRNYERLLKRIEALEI